MGIMDEQVAARLREDEELRNAWATLYKYPIQVSEVSVWHLSIPPVYDTYLLKEGDESWDQMLERIGINIMTNKVYPVDIKNLKYEEIRYDVPGEDPNGE